MEVRRKAPVVKREVQELLLLFEISQILDQSIELARCSWSGPGGYSHTDGDDARDHNPIEPTIR